MRISLSTLRKIIRESVNESRFAMPSLSLTNLANALKADGMPVAGVDNVTADDGLILQKEGNNIYIIIPFMDHPRLLEAVEEQISLVLQSKFGRVLTYVDVVGGLGPRGEDGRRKYLVDAPMDGQTGSAGASFAPSKRRYHNSPR